MKKIEPSDRKAWWMWSFVMATILLIYLSTISVSPHIDGDELTIVDLGRAILNPDTNWSIVWMTSKEQPVFLLSYLGPVLQEVVYEIMGQYGPRISSLIGAVAAAIAILGWLRARGTHRNVAFILSLVFFLDPIFVPAYTKGRVDGWSMAFCLAACWILRCADKSTAPRILNWNCVLAGSLTAISFFIWPTAVFLYPLVLLELFYLITKWKSTNGSWKSTIIPVLLFGLSGLIMGILLIIPIESRAFAQINNVIGAFKANTQNGAAFGDQSGFGITSFLSLLKALKFTPLLSLTAAIGLITKKQWGLLLAILVVLVLMLSTVVYIHRVQYLIPYLIASLAVACSYKSRNNLHASRFWTRGLVLTLAWSIFLSVFMRTFLSFYDQKDRDRGLISNAALTMIGKGDHSVLLNFPFEFYYTGRSLGWKMYAAYAEIGDKPGPEVLNQILHHVDYAILPKEMLTKEITSALEKEGINYQRSIPSYKQKTGSNFYFLNDFSKITVMDRLRILFRIYQQPYGPYVLYARNNISGTIP